MRLWKAIVSGLLTVSVLAGMQLTGMAEGTSDAGITVEIVEGSREGMTVNTENGISSGSSMDFLDTKKAAAGSDELYEEEEEEDYTTLEEWNIKVPIPEYSTSILDGSTGEFYIYPTGQDGIPYVMIMPFDYSGDGEAFLHAFKDRMVGYYEDLTVTEEIHETKIGNYDCWQTRYEYTISGYNAKDRRVALEHNGKIYMFATKEVPELELTVGDLLDRTVEELIFLDENDTAPIPDQVPAPAPAPGNGAASSASFTMTRIADTDTGLTLARMYAPSDYTVTQILDTYGAGDTACSPACPWQLKLAAGDQVNGNVMMYCSQMSYVYSQQMYQEGQLFYGISTMLTPMTASAYADWIVQNLYQNAGEIRCVDEKELSDAELASLQERAQMNYDYYNTSFASAAFMNMEGALSTYTQKEYALQQDGRDYTVIVVTATDLVQYTQATDFYSDTQVQMTVPYVYLYEAPSDEVDAGRGNFDLFVSNTRVSDEFVLATQKMSLALTQAITSGTGPDIDDDEIAEILGTDNGTYDTEEFCDYILSQDAYTTSDGTVIKVPNSYDYVYEGDNGNIYVSNSADEPAGSTRLYKK